MLPRILVATPTYDGKNYCLPEFIDNVRSFTYPRSRMEFMIFDNSIQNDNALMILKKYGVKTSWKNYSGYTIFQKLADTHERIRLHALNNQFDFVLHLESDVFPDPDVIEQLLWARKPIVSATYFIGNGSHRQIVTRIVNRGEPFNSAYASGIELGHYHRSFLDGEVKECLTNGLGCILISREILASTKFRYEPGKDMAPDSFYTNDLYQMNIRNWVHTGVHAFHWNERDWGNYSNLLTTSKHQ